MTGTSIESRRFWATELLVGLQMKYGWYGEVFHGNENNTDFELQKFAIRTDLFHSLRVCWIAASFLRSLFWGSILSSYCKVLCHCRLRILAGFFLMLAS